MKPLTLSLATAITVIIFSACAVPLVPTPAQLENAVLHSSMQLITEVRFAGLNPKLTENSKGPEMDQVPVLIPAPEAMSTRGWFFLPATQDTSGNTILHPNNSGMSDGAWVFGYNLQPGQSQHLIDAGNQLNSINRMMVRVPSPGTPFARVQAFPLAETPVPASSRLAILTQVSDSGSVPRPLWYISDQLRFGFSDTGFVDAGSGSVYLGQDALPFYDVYSGKWGTATAFSPMLPPYTGLASPVITMAPLQDRTGVGFLTFDPIPPFLYEFTMVPGAVGSMPTPGSFNFYASYAGTRNYEKLSYFTIFKPGFAGFLTSYNSTIGAPFVQLHLDGTINLVENPVSFPIVRTLQDGTVLALDNKHWRKVTLDALTGLPVSYGKAINTGTLQFVYDYTDGGGSRWMVFSEALVIPGTGVNNNGNTDNDLLMRVWQIKQDDLIK